MTRYADTSFLVPLYLMELHSATAVSILTHADTPIFVTPFGEVELTNALQLRVFRKAISQHDAHLADLAFGQDLNRGVFSLQPISPAVFELAKRLSRKHTSSIGTRSLDLLHVASAVQLGAGSFLSFDNNQRKLAEAAGLSLYPQTL